MRFSYKSTMDAVRKLHPELLDRMEAGHTRMDLPTLIEKTALEFFLKYGGSKTPLPKDVDIQASFNIHEALMDFHTKSHLEFGTEHFTTADIPVKRQSKP